MNAVQKSQKEQKNNSTDSEIGMRLTLDFNILSQNKQYFKSVIY